MGCFFYLGEPNTGEVTKSDTLKVTESLPNDVDDNGNPVHKILTLTLSDRNDETLLRQNAEGRIPAFESKFTEGNEFADFYVNNNGYEIIRLQYRWKVNADPNLTVTWDVQFTPYDGGPLHHEIHQWVTQGASTDPLAPYLIDPRIPTCRQERLLRRDPFAGQSCRRWQSGWSNEFRRSICTRRG